MRQIQNKFKSMYEFEEKLLDSGNLCKFLLNEKCTE